MQINFARLCEKCESFLCCTLFACTTGQQHNYKPEFSSNGWGQINMQYLLHQLVKVIKMCGYINQKQGTPNCQKQI
jgi:hypothetical protein